MSRNSIIVILVFFLAVVVVFNLLSGRSTKSETEEVQTAKPVSPSYKRYPSAPEMSLDKTKDYRAILKTSKGDITIDLYEKESPITVSNFIFLSREGFYNGTRFHRVIKGFMVQGGDPLGNGTGGPGYKFDDEPIKRSYVRGTVAMANSGPNTNGSQFFIVHKDYPLDKKYVIFGQVTSGMEVVDTIAEVPVRESPFGEKSSPVEDITVSSIEIMER